MDSKKPTSAPEILTILKDKHPTLNKSTIYRQLDFLVKKEILTVLEIDGSKRYQLNQNHPRAILLCTHCKKIILSKEKITSSKINKIAADNNFKVNNFSLIIFGHCQKCQKNKIKEA